METQTITNTNILPNEEGFFGNYGGQFLPEGLKAEFQKITECFEKLKNDVLFNKELNDLLNYYVKNKFYCSTLDILLYLQFLLL